MKVDVLLQGRKVNRAVGPHVVGVALFHHFASSLITRNTRSAHKHVVGLFLQHEVAGPAQRVER